LCAHRSPRGSALRTTPCATPRPSIRCTPAVYPLARPGKRLACASSPSRRMMVDSVCWWRTMCSFQIPRRASEDPRGDHGTSDVALARSIPRRQSRPAGLSHTHPSPTALEQVTPPSTASGTLTYLGRLEHPPVVPACRVGSDSSACTWQLPGSLHSDDRRCPPKWPSPA